jgi:acetyl-CoA carboxylase biotin carboxyl carrier protein
MSVDLRKVKKLIELVEESDISELEVRDGEETIRIARHRGGWVAPQLAPSAADPGTGADGGRDRRPQSAAFEVRSPMAGTFYRAPAPGADPFVSEGRTVEVGDVLCIIESMKMMNEIRAERPGTCTGIAAADGDAIGTGQLLFRFE